MNRSPLRRGFLLIPLALAFAWFGLAPFTEGQCPQTCNDTFRNTGLGAGALESNFAGTDNTAVGDLALSANVNGGGNTAVGSLALVNATGDANTAVGSVALYSNTSGYSNTAVGSGALYYNTSNYNVAIGVSTLYHNTTGIYNTAVGFAALDLNSTGVQNIAVGDGALIGNTTGSFNTAIGSESLYYNGNTSRNIAVGHEALYSFSSGSNNTAIGAGALRGPAVIRAELSTGVNNTANGTDALSSDTSGSYNLASGESALFNNTTGSKNIAVGQAAGLNLTTGNDNIDIGNAGIAGESRTIRIGTRQAHRNTFIAGISGATVPAGVAVIVDASGHLGTTTSSERFKQNIKPMDKASEAILALKPVTFCYKPELDPDGIPQFGLVAEEVEGVNRDLVARDDQGRPYSVRYEAVNSMLLNEFLKEHRKVTERGNEIAELKQRLLI